MVDLTATNHNNNGGNNQTPSRNNNRGGRRWTTTNDDSSRHSRNGHHNHHHHPPTNFGGALDNPLPVASAIDGEWRPRRKVHVTPRHLATLRVMQLPNQNDDNDNDEQQQQQLIDSEDTSSTKVCIVGDQFIVVATSNRSPLCVYKLSRAPSNSEHNTDMCTKPWSVVLLSNNNNENENDNDNEIQQQQLLPPPASKIVSLIALPFGQSLIYGETCRRNEEGHVVALTEDGQCFIVRIRRDTTAATAAAGGTTKIFEFSTMNFGVSCASVIPTSKGSRDCQLLIGYQSGYLENWKIFRFSANKTMAKMLWRGLYSNHCSIQSVAPLNITSNSSSNSKDGDNTTDTNANIQKPKKEKPVIETNKSIESSEDNDTHRYLLITLLSSNQNILTSDAMVEVIDIGDMPAVWKGHSTTTTSTTTTTAEEESLGHLRAIHLERRWILPQEGMEIIKSSSIATSHEDSDDIPSRTHFIPSQASGSICK